MLEQKPPKQGGYAHCISQYLRGIFRETRYRLSLPPIRFLYKLSSESLIFFNSTSLCRVALWRMIPSSLRLMDNPEERINNEDSVSASAHRYLSELDEETLRRAWGEDKTSEYRRRVVSAAIIFGRQLDVRMSENPPETDEAGLQRFLMALMNSAISEFARKEGLDEEAAAGFLGDVETRDHVLEFNEVLEEHHGDPNRSLDELLDEAIDKRQDKAIWADHWSSG